MNESDLISIPDVSIFVKSFVDYVYTFCEEVKLLKSKTLHLLHQDNELGSNVKNMCIYVFIDLCSALFYDKYSGVGVHNL